MGREVSPYGEAAKHEERPHPSLYEEARRRILPRLTRMLWSLMDPQTEAETVLYEAFQRVLDLNSKGGLDSSRNWWGLLYTTATHRAIDQLRHEQRRREAETQWASAHPPESPDTAETFVEGELEREVRNAIAKLTATEQLMVMAKYFEGSTQRKIAARLGVSDATVSRSLSEALRKLRTELKGDSG